MTDMRWIVGLDTRDRCLGAVSFAAWLRDHGGQDADDFVGVHVLERDAVQAILGRRDHRPEELKKRALEAARRALADANVDDPLLSEIELVETTSAERGLTQQVDAHGAAGLLIGRRAGQGDGTPYRLGRTARRLLRHLPVPVLVVPPDLRASNLGSGPILCAVDLDDNSVHAAETAARLATYLDRSLRIMHAVVLPETLSYYRGDQRLRQDMVDDLRRDATSGLAKWCDEHGLSRFAQEVTVGDPATTVHGRLEALDAPLVVTGSRRLSLPERLFATSLGTYLAATLPVPLLVVPPSTEAQ